MGMLGGGYKSGSGGSNVWDQQSGYLGDLFSKGQENANAFQPQTQVPGQAMGAWQNQLAGQQNPYLNDMAGQFHDQLGMMNQQTGGEAGLTGGYGGGRHGIAESQNLQNQGQQMGQFYGGQYQQDMQRQGQAIGQTGQMMGLDPQQQQWNNLNQYAGIIGAPHNEQWNKNRAFDGSIGAGK
jgi:hypothetical protein